MPAEPDLLSPEAPPYLVFSNFLYGSLKDAHSFLASLTTGFQIIDYLIDLVQ